MSTPSTHLIAISDLTFDSWKFFVQHWKVLSKKAIWCVVGFFAYFIFAGLAGYLQQDWVIIPGLIILAVTCIASWLMLARTTLQLHAPENMSSVSKSLPLSSLVLPILVIALLSIVVNTIGFIFLIIPGIWLAISLYFASLLLLEDNVRGMDALKASYRLVKGRWWATFGRLALPAIFYGILFGVIGFAMILIPVIAAIVASAALVPFSEGTSPAALAVPILILAIIFGLIWLAAYIALQVCAAIIQLIVQVKLFHSLKASREEHPAHHS